MKVKTLKAHSNQFGDKYTKDPGDIYDHPSPAGDIEFGYVEEAVDEDPETEKSPQTKKPSRTASAGASDKA